jgi:ABC-2 type transporter
VKVNQYRKTRMRGLLYHLALTLKLNFRSMQPIVYGYLVPVFFLVAFGTLFRSGKPPLVHEMGQLLTVTVLGGACFGMPTAIVAERERGVWRRYRLLPAGVSGIIISTMVARFVLLLSAVVMQIVLARAIYGTTWPAHPIAMGVAFVFASFAFLGMGLVIAMVAETVPAVQALGQAIFLPMIIVGGVGVPLRTLPPWAQHVAGFLPGRYAVETLQACEDGLGLSGHAFGLMALTGIGLAACVAGVKLFRWDVGQKTPPRALAWVAAAVMAWIAVGLIAEAAGQLRPSPEPASENSSPMGSTSIDSSAAQQPWQKMTRAQTDAITYDDLPDDGGTIAPVAASLDTLDDDSRTRVSALLDAVERWEPARTADIGQRVRTILSVCAVADVAADELEAYIPCAMFQQLQRQIPKDQLMQALTWVILKPDDGTVVTDLNDLGFNASGDATEVRERTSMYARKLLHRMLG